MKMILLLVAGFSSVFVLTSGAEKKTNSLNDSPYASNNYPINIYWNNTHLHTANSTGAALMSNLKGWPVDPFRFGRVIDIQTQPWTAHDTKKFKVKMTKNIPMVNQKKPMPHRFSIRPGATH